MGLFLAMSGVRSADIARIRQALESFAEAKGGLFEMRSGSTDDDGIGAIRSNARTTTLLYPQDFYSWDEYSAHLSRALQTPVFSFHIHDGDFWMFIAYRDGQEVARFNPIPEYWKPLDIAEMERWSGDAEAVTALIPGLSAANIQNYFIRWTEDESWAGRKAYPDDKFEYGEDWQLTDFMRRLGFEYPLDDSGNAKGDTFYLTEKRHRSQSNGPPSAPTDSHANPPSRHSSPDPKAKPWWKFW